MAWMVLSYSAVVEPLHRSVNSHASRLEPIIFISEKFSPYNGLFYSTIVFCVVLFSSFGNFLEQLDDTPAQSVQSMLNEN